MNNKNDFLKKAHLNYSLFIIHYSLRHIKTLLILKI